jgi:hypothetical protein
MNYRKINGVAAFLKPTTAAKTMITTSFTSAIITATAKKLHLIA